MEHLKKETLNGYVEKLKISYNSLSKAQAMALVALIVAEETGTEPKEAFVVAQQLDDLNAMNTSAMRKKISQVIFGKKADKKVSSADLGLSLLED